MFEGCLLGSDEVLSWAAKEGRAVAGARSRLLGYSLTCAPQEVGGKLIKGGSWLVPGVGFLCAHGAVCCGRCCGSKAEGNCGGQLRRATAKGNGEWEKDASRSLENGGPTSGAKLGGRAPGLNLLASRDTSSVGRRQVGRK